MSSFLLKENRLFKEKYYYTTLKSGLKIIVIPKDLPTAVAFLCCDFGGADVEYVFDGKTYTLPYGTAHFLEHKMFESAQGEDAFLEYDKYGGNANAFTSYDNTCYYFSCADNFYQNLEVLLKAVSSLHCTKKSVAKENKIIAREITMYEDLPNSNLNRNLHGGLYFNNPTVMPISGRIEDINQITVDTLYQAYNHFYMPSNLCLCVCGNVDMDKVLEYAEKYFGTYKGERPKTIFKPEPLAVKEKTVSQKAIVATPLYSIGIKCPAPKSTDIEWQRQSTAMRLAVSLLFGRASDFYCNNYEQGIINERFYAGYHTSRSTSYILISGSGSQQELLTQRVKTEIERRKADFFTDEQIKREINAAYAESITLFDNSEDLAAAVASSAFLDFDEFDCIDILRQITKAEIKEALNSIDTTNYTVSVIERSGDIC